MFLYQSNLFAIQRIMLISWITEISRPGPSIDLHTLHCQITFLFSTENVVITLQSYLFMSLAVAKCHVLFNIMWAMQNDVLTEVLLILTCLLRKQPIQHPFDSSNSNKEN